MSFYLRFLYQAVFIICLFREEGKCTPTPLPKIEESFSLFFTPQEVADFKKESQKITSPLSEDSSVCLHALFYSKADLWSLWINGKQYSSFQAPEFLKIVAVSAHKVHFQAQFDQKVHKFTLKPHQCYIPAQKHIQEMKEK